MATLKLLLVLPEGSSAQAKLTADWPSDDTAVEYRGDIDRLPGELTRARARPNLLEYFWKEYAAKTGAKICVELIGEWLPEDDVKPRGDVDVKR